MAESDKPEANGQNLKLLLLCQLFYPELISTGQTLTELCEVLVDMGVDIEVVCGPPTILERDKDYPRTMEHRGIRIRRVWGTRFDKLNIVGRVVNQLTFAFSSFFTLLFDRSKKPILVLTNPPFLAIACIFMKILRNRPYIFLVFDIYPDTAERLEVPKQGGIVSKIWNLANRFMYKYADIIVVIGRCMQDIIENKYPEETRDKIRLIHVWSDDKLILEAQGKENPYIDKWGLQDKFTVIYSGNMGRFHDMETIMEAAKLLKDHKEILFLLVGEGHKKEPSQEFAKSWELDNCRFHSYVPRDDLGFSLGSGRVGLISLMEGQEGLSVPSKTFGVMATGLPVIAVMSPRSEIARIVEEEQCGIIVKPGDAQALAEAVLTFYHDRDKLNQTSQRAKNAVLNKYNIEAAAKRYFEIIAELNKNIS